MVWWLSITTVNGSSGTKVVSNSSRIIDLIVVNSSKINWIWCGGGYLLLL